MRGVKQSLLYARDHSLAEGLAQAADWNVPYGISAYMDRLPASLRAGTRKN